MVLVGPRTVAWLAIVSAGMTERSPNGAVMRSRSWTVAVVVGVATLSILMGATAYGAIPDTGTGMYHGCVAKKTGVLRVIDPAAGGRCSTARGREETAIVWSKAGATGPVGGAKVDTRTRSQTLRSSQMVNVAADCKSGYVPVNGFWTVNGQPGVGNEAVFYSLGDTGETATGYKVRVGKNSAAATDPVVTAREMPQTA